MLLIWLDNDDNMQYLIRTYLEVKFGVFIKKIYFRFNSQSTINTFKAQFFYTEVLEQYDRVMVIEIKTRDGQAPKFIAKRITENIEKMKTFYPAKQQLGWPPITCLRQEMVEQKDVVARV